MQSVSVSTACNWILKMTCRDQWKNWIVKVAWRKVISQSLFGSMSKIKQSPSTRKSNVTMVRSFCSLSCFSAPRQLHLSSCSSAKLIFFKEKFNQIKQLLSMKFGYEGLILLVNSSSCWEDSAHMAHVHGVGSDDPADALQRMGTLRLTDEYVGSESQLKWESQLEVKVSWKWESQLEVRVSLKVRY